jgi:hypothetical protein
MANERARGLGYKYITDDKYLVNPFSPTDGISYEGDGSPVSYANSGIMNQAPIPEPLQYIPRDGGNDNNNDDDDNINPYTGPSVSPWEAAKAAGLFALNPPAYLLQKIASKGIRAFKDYRNKNKIEKYTQEPMSNYRDDRPSSEKNYTGGDTNSNPSTPGAQDSFSNKSGMGRTGYFFGGRVNYKAGGRTDAESQYGADSAGSYDSSQNQSGRQQSYGGDSNNLVTGVDINKEINKKLTSMIPDRVDKNQLLFDNAKRYQTLSKNRNSPFFMNRSNGPKTINKNLYTNNLTDLNLQYPDIKIKNEYGMVDADKAKSLIDQAILEQTISPVEGLNLTRSIDTTGTQSNTSGDYTMGNFNFSSPNIEGGVLNSKANYNLGDLNLNANLNTNDSTINDSRLGFNYGDGALTGSTFRDKDYGYTTNKLGVDKKFNVGNNFNIGVDGNYKNTIYNGENYRDSEFTPSLNYNDGTFNANLSKEIVEGGTQPNLGIGFQKNGFYGNANNLLSQNPTSTIGYQKNIGSPDGPLQFSARGEIDPYTGQKTAGLYGTLTFKNGGLASIL